MTRFELAPSRIQTERSTIELHSDFYSKDPSMNKDIPPNINKEIIPINIRPEGIVSVLNHIYLYAQTNNVIIIEMGSRWYNLFNIFIVEVEGFEPSPS